MKKYLLQFQYSIYEKKWNQSLRWGQRTIKARDEQEAKAKLSFTLNREGKSMYNVFIHKEIKQYEKGK